MADTEKLESGWVFGAKLIGLVIIVAIAAFPYAVAMWCGVIYQLLNDGFKEGRAQYREWVEEP